MGEKNIVVVERGIVIQDVDMQAFEVRVLVKYFKLFGFFMFF